MSANRAVRVAATGARLVTGAVVAVACAAGVVVGVSAPWPAVVAAPARTEVAPQAGDTVVVCTGDLRALGRDASDPLAMQSAADAALTAGSSDGDYETSALEVEDLPGAGEVRRLTATADESGTALIGAAESVTAHEDDLAGFAAAPCRAPASSSWILGGTVATGAEDLIVLSNPGAVPSTVTLTVYGTVRAASTTIVAAGTQLAVPLSSIASGSDVPVVEVSAEGSPVRAVLQSSLTQTLDPVGIDLQDAIAAPQRNPVVAGVSVYPDESDDAAAAILRLMSPGHDTTARVSVRAVGSSTVESSFDVELAADMPAQVGLSSLDPGDYTVSVEADAALLAGVRMQDGVAPGSDFAWAMPAPEVADDLLFAVPAGPAARLFLVNDGDVDAQVELTPQRGGGASSIVVEAGSSTSVDVDARTVYALTTSAAVRASVAMTAKGALAFWPLWPAAGAQGAITVYP
ncbi:DUF5719 family protein [Microbacterium sp.]|uniref:DUF5719 family protein n=1 Tax=Microbacterium sp. TaxID=51671 RepID=UPI0039E6035E